MLSRPVSKKKRKEKKKQLLSSSLSLKLEKLRNFEKFHCKILEVGAHGCKQLEVSITIAKLI